MRNNQSSPKSELEAFIDQVGGAAHYDMALMEFSYSVVADKGLRRAFQGMKSDDIACFQREVLKLAFAEDSDAREAAKASLSLGSYSVVKNGLTAELFDKTISHFVGGLQQVWAAEATIKDVERRLVAVRYVFKADDRAVSNGSDRRISKLVAVSAQSRQH